MIPLNLRKEEYNLNNTFWFLNNILEYKIINAIFKKIEKENKTWVRVK
jgi:hypothetical protein